MRRVLNSFFVLTLAGGIALSGCAKKSASTPATGDQAGAGDTSGMPKESDVSGGSVSLNSLPIVYFGFNEASIRAEDRDNLKAAAAVLKTAKAKVTIEGHCDERGSTEYNLALGERRAQAVKSYLSKLGVSAGNLATISYGEERPAEEGHSESSWDKNRRGVLVLNR
jgi:peptidoglycan-associated lipoprotein